MKTRNVTIDHIRVGRNAPLVLIAGPCVIENYEATFETALFLKQLTDRLDIPFIFKASYDKANRSSLRSFRGPGLTEGIRILSDIKNELNVPVLSDVHEIHEISVAARVLDVIQVPAFLCRQTDFIIEAAKTGKPLNIKKGQFLAPWDIVNVAEKALSTGNDQLMITERGAMFGYNNLVVDFRGVKIIQDMGLPVIFDATHSVQLPGGQGSCSGGQREFVPTLAQAAVGAGVNGVFMEVHKNPAAALCDGPNSLELDNLETLAVRLIRLHTALSREP